MQDKLDTLQDNHYRPQDQQDNQQEVQDRHQDECTGQDKQDRLQDIGDRNVKPESRSRKDRFKMPLICEDFFDHSQLSEK